MLVVKMAVNVAHLVVIRNIVGFRFYQPVNRNNHGQLYEFMLKIIKTILFYLFVT
jgi:hypothetical protein